MKKVIATGILILTGLMALFCFGAYLYAHGGWPAVVATAGLLTWFAAFVWAVTTLDRYW